MQMRKPSVSGFCRCPLQLVVHTPPVPHKRSKTVEQSPTDKSTIHLHKNVNKEPPQILHKEKEEKKRIIPLPGCSGRGNNNEGIKYSQQMKNNNISIVHEALSKERNGLISDIDL